MYENYVELNNNIVKICDCFTAPEDAEDIRVGEEISRIVRRAFLYRFMSYVTDDCENKGMEVTAARDMIMLRLKNLYRNIINPVNQGVI